MNSHFSRIKWPKFPISKLTGTDVTSDVEGSMMEKNTLSLLEKLADFIDRHDIVIPEFTVRVKGVELSLTGRKLEDADASEKIKEAKHEAKPQAEQETPGKR